MPITDRSIYTITPQLLSLVESIAALRERILGAGVELAWVPALQKDARTRTVHARRRSRAIR